MTKQVDVDGLRERLRQETRRLERLDQGQAPWRAITVGRASGLALAASFLDEFTTSEETAA